MVSAFGFLAQRDEPETDLSLHCRLTFRNNAVDLDGRYKLVKVWDSKNVETKMDPYAFELEGKPALKTIAFNVINVIVGRVKEDEPKNTKDEIKVNVFRITSSRFGAPGLVGEHERTLRKLINKMHTIKVLDKERIQFVGPQLQAILVKADLTEQPRSGLSSPMSG